MPTLKCCYKTDLNKILIIAKAVIAIFGQNQVGNDSELWHSKGILYGA